GLRDLPVPARLVLRPPPRRPARRLARRRRPLRPGAGLLRAGGASRDDPRLARRLRALPVALAARAGVVAAADGPHGPLADRLHRLAPELRRRLRARRARGARPPAVARRARRDLMLLGSVSARRRRLGVARPRREAPAAHGRRPVLRRAGAALAAHPCRARG